nr:YkgJ family cysteine cluster protein [uncultured Pseudogulbenkiania sp.]
MSEKSNPCLRCGACCAAFRVSFYWAEAEAEAEAEADGGGGPVPLPLTEKINDSRRCMRGTWSDSPRCVALRGEVGREVGCAIYPQRSSTGREFEAYTEACNRARGKYGLAELPVLVAAA